MDLFKGCEANYCQLTKTYCEFSTGHGCTSTSGFCPYESAVNEVNLLDVALAEHNPYCKFEREVSCFINGDCGIISLTSDDNTGGVDFDWEKIWGSVKTSIPRQKNVTMIHTHPFNYCYASHIDENMVKGWRLALGVPVLFFIFSYNEIQGHLKGKCYECDKNDNGKIFITEDPEYDVEHFDFKLGVLAKLMYGLSKVPVLTDEGIFNIEKELVDASEKGKFI